MYLATFEETGSFVNNVMLSEKEQQLANQIKYEIWRGNYDFSGVFLLAQSIHRGYDSEYFLEEDDQWHLWFEECDEVNWWYPSDVSLLIAYGYLLGDKSFMRSYPLGGSYGDIETIIEEMMEEWEFVSPTVLPQLYEEYDTDDPKYVGSRYYKRMSA